MSSAVEVRLIVMTVLCGISTVMMVAMVAAERPLRVRPGLRAVLYTFQCAAMGATIMTAVLTLIALHQEKP